MDSNQKTPRGRARGRARSVPTGPEPTVEPPPVQVFGEAQPGEGRRLSGGSGSGDSTNGANGRGSGNGSGNGNGNGHGSNGNSSNGSPRGGSPRGMTPRPLDDAAQEREKNLDFVMSRPTPDFNKKGVAQHPSKPCPRIIANYYEFKTHPSFMMKLYSVKITPENDDQRVVRRLILSQKEQFEGSYMLTGLNLYVLRPLPEGSLIFNAIDEDTSYEVTLTFVRDIECSESTTFTFYNIVVRQMQRLLGFKLLGRYFFDPEANTQFPAHKLELWPGFQNSIRQQEAGLMLNVDGVWKVLRTSSVKTIMDNLRQRENFQEACKTAIVGLMVITKYGPNYRGTRNYKISRIDFAANPTHEFETKNGKISYAAYYRERYGVTIQDMGQPMLVCEPKIRDIRRGQVGDIYLVPELCFPCGLTDDLRSNFKLMKDLAICLHQAPDERVGQMQKFVNRIYQNENIMTVLKSWSLKLKRDPVEIDGRYLKGQEVVLFDNKTFKADDKGDWTNAFRGTYKMLSSATLKNWVVIAGNRDKPAVAGLVKMMKQVATPLGYIISDPDIVSVGNPRDYAKVVGDTIAKKQGQLDLVFVILQSNNAETYAAVKKRCTVDFGIPSQCFLSKNLTAKGLMSICTKLVIQMNAKQGGEPWGIANPIKNVLVIGYDVHHAGPGSGSSSISAMCASINPSLGKYYSYIRKTPTARQEIAEQFAAMFEKCVAAWKEKNGGLPEKIFIYRDGVGEGQLWDVFNVEVAAVKEKIASAYGAEPLPKLTYIVVNKRLSTRFFQKGGRGYSNPMPGLVIDSVVTRPERYDFFLISQTARQGCVGPTYYNVLLDESKLSPDKLQMYTFKMCHLYYNWSGTVAVPGACQYAHKLALQTGTALKRPADPKLSYLLHFL